MAKKKSKKILEKKYMNDVFRGDKLQSGTTSFQVEEYEGFKYIKQILKFFKGNSGAYHSSDIIKSLVMLYEDQVPFNSFVQLRIIEVEKYAHKTDERTFKIGKFGQFLLDKYFSSRYEVMLLSAFLNYSIIPYIIYDLNQILNQELIDVNINKTELLKELNLAKRNIVQTLLGLYTSSSDSVYCTIPIFYKNKDSITNKTIIQEYNPELKEQASIICLDFAIEEIFLIIQNLRIGTKLFITLEDLYNYLVRPERIIEGFSFEVFKNNSYPFSGMLYFLRDEVEEAIEDEDVYLFKKIFRAVQSRNKFIKVESILDDVIKKDIKNLEFYERIEYLK